jgi:hypothetical protein
MMTIESGIIPPRLGKVVPSPGVMNSTVTPWEEVGGWGRGRVGGEVGAGAYHGEKKSESSRRGGGSS